MTGHSTTPDGRPDWLTCLDEEDLAFLRRFVLGSGSLKAVASAYGVSYPTVRLRLDRVIQKVRIYEDHAITSPFERLLRSRVASGAVDPETARRLLAVHRAELDETTKDHEEAPDADARTAPSPSPTRRGDARGPAADAADAADHRFAGGNGRSRGGPEPIPGG